jgi:hypothetical protein
MKTARENLPESIASYRLRTVNAELLERLERAEKVIGIIPCDECNHSLVLHFDRYGCEYERGDTQVQDVGAVALGPCGCKAENLSDDGKDAFTLLRDLRNWRGMKEQ